MRKTLAFVCGVVALLLALPAVAQAPFSGKTVTILVGYSPGGGYDRVARIVARHLPRYLPGNPTVVVQNMPGANSIVAANHLYNVARPDGLTIGLFNRNLVLGQLVGVEGLRVDMRRWQWIGSPAEETDVFAIRADLPYRQILDLRRADPAVAIGATGPGANTYDFPLVLKAFLKLNLRIISGYPSSADIMLAIERREVDGRAGSWSSLKPFVERGLVRPLVRTRSDNPELRAIPVDQDLVTEAVAKSVLRLRAIPNRLGRPFVAPPGAPAEMVRAYRDAFRRMTQDREFVAEAERAGVEVSFTSPEEIARILEEVFSTPAGTVRVFKEFFRFE
jgi:tripartite-type tricarboxylate transporter receptor subunit TctC